jgi:hypothetical protein
MHYFYSDHLDEEPTSSSEVLYQTPTYDKDEWGNFDSDMSVDTCSEVESGPEESVYISSSDNENEDEIKFDASSSSKMKTAEKSDPPLYVLPPQEVMYVSNISKSEHVMAIAAYATRHNLSNVALQDLLDIIKLHLPPANTSVQSVKILKEECGFDQNYLQFKFFCGICKKNFTNNEEKCSTPDCKGTTAEQEYFVKTDISIQLKELLERPGIWDSIQEGKDIPDSQIISDIKSGLEYRKLKQPGAFLDNPNNISFSLFTDGVPLFKSSSVSLWPVYLLVNELPPTERFLCKNMILWGIWQGNGKPRMVSFLKPLVEDLNKLYHQGFEFIFNKQIILSKAILLIVTMDLQARAFMLQMTHHNGEYGCLYCHQKGVSVPSGAGHCRSYQYEDNLDMRTDESVRNHSKEARSSHKRVMGFYGETVFLYLSCFSLVNNVVVDYMHGALLGVVKKFMELWFDPKFSQHSWFIGTHTKVIDRHLQSIKPPYFIHRRPRAITKTYHHWKASELRNWLLFYSIPCLLPFLEKVYLVHFSCLAEGVYILLGEGISPAEIARANLLLCTFAKNVEKLYGPQYMSMNVHNLVHLADIVKRWGPLWCWSCFPYESFNGTIMDTIHGTGNVCKDVFWQLQAKKRVEKKIAEISEDSFSKQKIIDIIKSKNHSIKEGNAKQCHVVKPFPIKTITAYEAEFLQSKFKTTDKTKFHQSSKIVHNGFVMYSHSTKKIKRQNSYTIMMHSGSAMEVDKYIVHVKSGQVFASGHVFQLSDPILPNRVYYMRQMNLQGPLVVKVSNLREPLIVINGENKVFAALLPNHHETD